MANKPNKKAVEEELSQLICKIWKELDGYINKLVSEQTDNPKLQEQTSAKITAAQSLLTKLELDDKSIEKASKNPLSDQPVPYDSKLEAVQAIVGDWDLDQKQSKLIEAKMQLDEISDTLTQRREKPPTFVGKILNWLAENTFFRNLMSTTGAEKVDKLHGIFNQSKKVSKEASNLSLNETLGDESKPIKK